MIDGLITLEEALRSFIDAIQTQDQGHIRPLHQHLVQRLVIEGGFLPEDVAPSPPLRSVPDRRRGRRARRLEIDTAQLGVVGERVLLGGLKTKAVDVVVTKAGIGPCVAISVKGSVKAFRNLTNRMEEAIGDCTNLHITYPSLVYGFFHVMRANRAVDGHRRADIAICDDDSIADPIHRYHDVLQRLTGRGDLRNEFSRYEAIALALVDMRPDIVDRVMSDFPFEESPLRFERFFESLYTAYDLRYVYSAPMLKRVTQRVVWSESPALDAARAAGFVPRVGEVEFGEIE